MPRFSQGLPASVRREQIVSIIERKGFARVVELSRQLSVSEVTIRTDLDYLGEANVIQRVHGGAVSGIKSTAYTPDYERALARGVTEKRRIGHAAAMMVESGMAILLDAGTTTLAIARSMINRKELRGVVVFTNSLSIALELGRADPTQVTVVVTGGTVNFNQRSLIDPLGDMVIGAVHADLCFIGCNGVSPQGFTNSSLPAVTVKKRYLDAAEKRVAVADSSKIGKSLVAQIAPLDRVELLITGVEAAEEELLSLGEAGLAVQTV